MKRELDIYKDKTVLVTGHTGFKGSWLSIWLNELGAQVIGYALQPYTEKDNFVVANLSKKIADIRGDIRDYEKLRHVFHQHSPEIVFHMAAQSLVIDGYKNPKETYDVNVGGTVNILENCRLSKSVRVIINVTSDKCYEIKKLPHAHQETDSLGGNDPYSSSKACSELTTSAYRYSFFTQASSGNHHSTTLSSVRAGNVIGGGDWRENRIVPDCIRALEKNELIHIRNPDATRPWQYVLEPLGGYLLLGAKMYENSEKYCGAWNFGPEPTSILTVEELVSLLIKKYGKGSWRHKPGQSSFRETTHLSLDISKAHSLLGWQPVLSITEAVGRTVDWYKLYNKSPDMYDYCRQQIIDYMKRTSEL